MFQSLVPGILNAVQTGPSRNNHTQTVAHFGQMAVMFGNIK